ncbi:hypothetical protein ACLOJK_022414, partial [Asimina triloba]
TSIRSFINSSRPFITMETVKPFGILLTTLNLKLGSLEETPECHGQLFLHAITVMLDPSPDT